MKKSLITIDIDDVIADSTESFRLTVNKHTGAHLTPEDYRVPYTAYNRYYEHIWKSHGLHVLYDEVSLPMQLDQSHVPLIKDAQKAIGVLSSQYDILFITSRPISWQDATHAYIGTHFKGLQADVHFVEKREGVQKGQICKELGAIWHIDDNPDHCQSVLDEGINTILFGEYGWHYREVKGAVKCKDWAAVLEYFDAK